MAGYPAGPGESNPTLVSGASGWPYRRRIKAAGQIKVNLTVPAMRHGDHGKAPEGRGDAGGAMDWLPRRA